MEFALTFLQTFFLILKVGSPILVFLIICILVLGLGVGRIENWKPREAIYWSLITATTVGYGDFTPSRRITQILAILIATIGLVMFGIIVAVAVQATTVAVDTHVDIEKIRSVLT